MARVVIVGGSLGGLTAAAALADEAALVTVLERDAAPLVRGTSVARRRGTPQDGHLHTLQCGGVANLEALLPGFAAQMRRLGALEMDRATELHAMSPAGELYHDYETEDGARDLVFVMTRPVVDAAARAVLREKFPNVTICWETAARGLRFDGGGRVAGVALADGRALDADLVVDATGRNSALPAWLAERGLGETPAYSYRMDLGYSTLIYKLPGDGEHHSRRRGDHLTLCQPQPFRGNHRGGAVVRLTPEAAANAVLDVDPAATYAMATLWGNFDHQPRCRTAEEATAFMARLPFAAVARVLQNATPVDGPRQFAKREQTWRRFDALPQWPDGLVATGDAVVSLNPAFGQGIAVSSKMALVLRRHARELLLNGAGSPGAAQRCQRELCAQARTPFFLNALLDGLMPQTTFSGLPLAVPSRLLWPATRLLLHAASKSAVVMAAFMRVADLRASVFTLLHPSVVARVLYWAAAWVLTGR